jgi:TPR repeat protein
MLPWKNPWFQIAFFALAFSGVLLIMDYAPAMLTFRRGTQASQAKPAQPSEGDATHASPGHQSSGQQLAPAKPFSPLAETPIPSREEKSAPKTQPPAQPPTAQPPAAPAAKTIPSLGSNRSAAQQPQSNTAAKPAGGAGGWDSYEKAAAKGDASAVNTIKSAANQGNVTAQYIVGKLYEKGEGVKPDHNEAMKWYSLAAVQGNVNAKQALDRLRAH